MTDRESKSVVLANPPFGAERDQEAYPDVWGEYAKESETTILFVKLMFELLKEGGRCAVVVSEGFHTWDQFSAKALRKMLLDETNLKAIISLPQGLFVSKSGQGPKTSILLFEKGGKTDRTWFYKVTNDGYTMGTNRKEQKGCQLVDCLTLYHKYVKHGKIPPESKNQFFIPTEWIKTLDPRIKEKIRIETRADMEEKGKIEREKKAEELDKKIEAKKLKEADKNMELKVFDHKLENRIQNEIAKRIDKAHYYSFNLANYKSTLSESQITDWNDALRHIKPNTANTLEEVYKKLKNGKPEDALRYIKKLNPVNALEADIAREYVSNLDDSIVTGHKELNTIKEILRSTAKYEKEKLGNLMSMKRDVLKLEDFNPDYRIVEKIRFKDGAMILRNDSETGIDLQFADLGDLLISKINFHQGATAINNYGKVLTSLDYLVYEVDRSKAIPAFIHLMVRDKFFIQYVSENKPGGIKGRSKPEFIEVLEIPLPSLDEQTDIVAQIEKQKAIIEGVDKVVGNWEVKYSSDNCTQKALGDVIELQRGHDLPISMFLNGKYPVVGSNGIIGYHNVFKCKSPGVVTGRSGTIGKVHFIENDYWPHNTSLFVKDFKDNEPKFVYYLLQTIDLKSLAENNTAVPSLDRKNAHKLLVQVPNDIETQRQIAAELDTQMKVLEGLRKMKAEAEKKIEKILAEVWGIESTENPEVKE